MHNLTPLSGLFGGALIGLAAASMMVLTGRVAGVSGIFGGLLALRPTDQAWRIAFVAGLIAAPLLAALAGVPLPRPAMTASLALIAVGGLLVGFGSRMSNGCTSGHGVCGLARFSARSIVATVVFMAAAVITVAVVRHGFADSAMPLIVACFGCGLMFGAGLLISGMTQPEKVLGFLDIFGAWDATLAFVMTGAVVVTMAGFALARRRGTPVLATKYLWPSRRDIDPPLVAGAVLFGIGWGLVGICPGPALVNLAGFSLPIIVFVVAMTLGMLGYEWLPTPRPSRGVAGNSGIPSPTDG